MLVVKFSDPDCGTCAKMSHYDAKVAAELNLEFVDCKLDRLDDWKQYRSLFMKAYPDKEGIGFPTYVVADEVEHPKLFGFFKGGSDKGEYRRKLEALL